MKTIAVIGGGITGITTAYALAKRGFAVTLLEKHRYAAMETSFANGGQLSASNAEVWNHWSTILKGIKWMLKSDAPLLVNPKPSWHKPLARRPALSQTAIRRLSEFVASNLLRDLERRRDNDSDTAMAINDAMKKRLIEEETEDVDEIKK